LTSRSRIKSDKLRVVEDGARQLQAKALQIKEKIYKIIDIRNELNTLKQERTRDVWLLKKDIEILNNQNKAQKKAHHGNSLLSTLSLLNVVE
jgi:hypothetical protein